MRVVVITSARRRARTSVLSESLEKCCPGAELIEFWCDPRVEAPIPPGVLAAANLDLTTHRWADMVVSMGERRAGWAALPWLAEHLSEGDAGTPVLFLDDSFVVLADPSSLFAPSTVVARSAHVDPVTGLGWGGPLPGLLAVSDLTSPALQWWRRRVEEYLSHDTFAESFGVDPWWAPSAAVELTSDPAVRLSPSTTAEVPVDDALGAPSTNGAPLELIDLGAFDPTSPWWFAPADSEPLLSGGESAGLRRLCHELADRLRAAGWTADQDDRSLVPIPGMTLTPAMSDWFRAQLAADGPGATPNPYVVGEVASFVDMLQGPGASDGTGVSIAADLVYDDRADVRGAFPRPRWRDREAFRRWMWTHGLSDGEFSLPLLPAPPRPAAPVRVTGERRPFGVNLVGYLGAELGLGVAARRMQHALEAAGVPTATVTYDRTASQQRTRSDGSVDQPYHANLMLIVPDQLPLFADDVGPGFFEGHHNIGLWYWESDVLTEHQKKAFAYVDEVWGATQYLCDAFASADAAPVALVPSPLVFSDPEPSSDDRKRLGLDDRFTFLFSFDFLSVVDRKNPLGLLEAYRRAFPTEGDTRLVLKSINGDVFPFDRERVADAVAEHGDVELWDRMLSAKDRMALVAAADCYVSLHRAEGLGLTMAEAMAVGTPVIATAYSGNLDFMSDRGAVLVPADVVAVGPGHYYPPEGHWADPDLDAAADAMRSVRSDAALRSSLSDGAHRCLEPFSYERVGVIARDQLLESWNAGRGQGDPQRR